MTRQVALTASPAQCLDLSAQLEQLDGPAARLWLRTLGFAASEEVDDVVRWPLILETLRLEGIPHLTGVETAITYRTIHVAAEHAAYLEHLIFAGVPDSCGECDDAGWRDCDCDESVACDICDGRHVVRCDCDS